MNDQETKTKKNLWWVLVFLLLIFFDQTAKYFYTGKIFQNNKFVFSLPFPQWLMFSLYAVILFFIIKYCAKNYQDLNKRQWFAWTLIMAGAVSNIGERIALGYVRDFVYIFNGVFNIADGYIITGIIILLLQQMFPKRGTGRDSDESGIMN